MAYCIYLRKSRADIEKEKDGSFETLKRHKTVLLKYASENNLSVTRIYEEIVSGESVIHRPQMLELLKDVEEKRYQGVLVMDIDRLGRGNMQEQGLILETFKNAHTLIVTPRKTYNLHDEFDEEYSEFEAFMARKELKIINRRLQRGRIRSIEEGNYIGTRPPFGYDIKKDGKRRILVPNSDQAPIVEFIFETYANEDLGSKKIAVKLNEMGIRSYTDKPWTSYSVLNVLKNRVCIGNIEWKKKTYRKSKNKDKIRETSGNPESEWIICENAHEPIIDKELFQKARMKLRERYHVPYKTKITNPFAGLIICKKCGASMVYRPYGEKAPHIVCYKSCGNKSSKFVLVEDKILLSIKELLEYNLNLEKELQKSDANKQYTNTYGSILKSLKKELADAESQKDKLHDLLEQGIYNTQTFLDRSTKLSEKLQLLTHSIEKLESEISLESTQQNIISNITPKLKNVLDTYSLFETAEQKNNLLKTVIAKIEYFKAKDWKLDNFELTVYPKL